MGAHRSARTRTAARDRSNALTVAAADPGREHDSITADAVRSRPRKVTSTWVDPVAPREQPAHVPPAGQDAKHNRESIMSRTPSETLCELFVEQVPVAGASITVFRRPGAQSTIGSSDALSARLDQLQFDLGEGPRWETARTGLPSVSEDVGRDAHPEWPIFGAAAAELGVGALFSFPIRIGTQLLGVADLYRDAAGALGGEATARALTVSHQVAVPAVDAASRSADSAREAPTAGVELRREVHQAVGMALMQMDIASAEAFAVLRAYAFSHGSSLDAVAREVLSRRLDFSTHPIESTEES